MIFNFQGFWVIDYLKSIKENCKQSLMNYATSLTSLKKPAGTQIILQFFIS
jgi:hypothetical protein